MADTPILNYKGKYDGPEIDKAVELALGLENPESCPYYVHVSLSHPDYALTVGLGDAEGNLFNYAEIDLPLESMVVNATYENGNIILHLQDGTSTEPIPISALIAGLVSETRTIAGIDLEDDITQKELRDALDVYTKDSVDQLVSELENTINETLNEMEESLNDLSDLTSEHDTQIKKNTSAIATNKNDITINRATLGIQCINIFDGNLQQGGIQSTNGAFYVADDSVASGNFIKVSKNVTISISRTVGGGYIVWRFYDKDKNYIGYASEENVQIISGGSGFHIPPENSNFACFKLVNPNIAYAKFVDSTNDMTNIYLIVEGEYTKDTVPSYEPYVPSVNERLVEVEESVSELTPQVEQNKSDISLAKNDIAINRTTLGTQCKNLFDYETWKTYASNPSVGLQGTFEEVDNGFKLTATRDDSFTGGWIASTGFKIPIKPNTSYILSYISDSNKSGTIILFENGSGQIRHYNSNGNVYEFSTKSDTAFITIRFGVTSTGDSITYTNIMIRPADITDNTYEPYKPSLQEQINALVAEIAELKANQTTVSE